MMKKHNVFWGHTGMKVTETWSHPHIRSHRAHDLGILEWNGSAHNSVLPGYSHDLVSDPELLWPVWWLPIQKGNWVATDLSESIRATEVGKTITPMAKAQQPWCCYLHIGGLTHCWQNRPSAAAWKSRTRNQPLTVSVARGVFLIKKLKQKSEMHHMYGETVSDNIWSLTLRQSVTKRP